MTALALMDSPAAGETAGAPRVAVPAGRTGRHCEVCHHPIGRRRQPPGPGELRALTLHRCEHCGRRPWRGVQKVLIEHRASLDDDLDLIPLEDLFDDVAPSPNRNRPLRSALELTETPSVSPARVAHVDDSDWRHRARCTDDQALDEARLDHDSFTADTERERTRAAAFCHACPVREQCYRTALAVSTSPWGVWGGVDFSGRSATWRARRRAEIGLVTP